MESWPGTDPFNQSIGSMEMLASAHGTVHKDYRMASITYDFYQSITIYKEL